MTDPKPQPEFLFATGFYRPKNAWCDPCAKSSVIEGPVVKVDCNGIAPWGFLRRCRDCRNRTWISLKGNVIPVECSNN